MSDPTTLIFEIYRDGALLRTEELSQDIIKVGKLPSSHLRLDDPNVSRIHAVVERSRNGEIFIIDLGSTKGTLVNGAKVNKVQLSSGDEILLGDTRIKFRTSMDAHDSAREAYDDAATAVGVSAMVDGAGASGRSDSSSVVTDGYYDEQGNWHDGTGGYYDPQGNYHDPSGGWYDSDGNYFDGTGGHFDAQGEYHQATATASSDTEWFTDNFAEHYDNSGMGQLEVAFLWNDHVLAVNQYKSARTITVGEASKNTLQVKHDSIPARTFPLVQGRGRVATLNFTDGMGGVVHVADRSYSLKEAVNSGLAQPGDFGSGSYSLTITAETRVRLDIGSNTFLIHYAEPSRRVPIGGFALEGSFVALLMLSGFLHAVFMFLVFFIPPNADGFELDGFDLNNRFVSQLIEPEKPEELPEHLKDDEEDGAKVKEDEGKAGKKDSKDKDKKLTVKGDKENKEVKLAKDTEVVNDKLAELGVSSTLTASWATSDQTLGMAAITAIGDNNGSMAGDASGNFGFGRVGTGRAGGGVSERGVGGGGGLGTAGKHGGDGNSQYGREAGQLDERKPKIPVVIGGRPTVSGALDKEIIRRVIRKNRRAVKYCYEKELIKNRNLAGRVVVSFTISSTGRVVAAVAKASTINNKAVERCLTNKVRRWIFPEPKGGGLVRVSYPFVFKAK